MHSGECVSERVLMSDTRHTLVTVKETFTGTLTNIDGTGQVVQFPGQILLQEFSIEKGFHNCVFHSASDFFESSRDYSAAIQQWDLFGNE